MNALLRPTLALLLPCTACGRESLEDRDAPDDAPPAKDDEVDARVTVRRDAGAPRPTDASAATVDAASPWVESEDAEVPEEPPDAGAPPSPPELPTCPSNAPAEFTANASVGGGGGSFTDSPHFRIYGGSQAQAKSAIDMLEAAYECFVETLCWRSSGLSYNATDDDGPYTKVNIYVVSSLPGAAGVMSSDARAGMSFLRVATPYVADPGVTVHEYGHALTYHEQRWVDQTRTGAWWETVANWVADTYMTSELCAPAREAHGLRAGKTIIDLNKTIGDSFQVLVDGTQGSGNYYQAWPFLTFLTTNLDRYPGLGATGLRDLFRQHMRNNETPLHVLARVAAPATVQEIVGRYWARMAYLDIGHPLARQAFVSQRSRLDYANLDATGSGSYRVKTARRPRYFGANIVPLSGTGAITARVTSSDPFTATLAIQDGDSVRYVALKDGAAEATLRTGEEASLVVVNTPSTLYQYDPFSISPEANRGLDYTVQLTGATAR